MSRGRRPERAAFDRRQWYGSGAGAGQDTGIIFESQLLTTLVPQQGGGDRTPTFTRATTATVTDFEGLVKTALSGEARMQGARRVANLVSFSEDFSNAAWVKTNSTVNSGVSDPVGSTGAWTLTATAATGQLEQSLSGPNVTGVNSIWIRRRTGTGTVNLGAPNGSAVTDITSVLTTSWQRFSVSGTNILYHWMQVMTSGDAVDIWRPQTENAQGQANQNPSEYVSVGVLSAPYHGAGVDGVKYFAYENGNTVASNIVTEAPGAYISTSTLKGFLAEGARTNSILQSNTLGTTWTISNAADMEAVSANQYVSVDGETTMDKLQPKATTAVHSLDQAFTFTAAKYTCAADLRYVAATPQRWVALILNDGTTTWGASFDLLNGVVGAVSAGATSGIETTGQANVYRVWVTNTANAAAAAGTVKISLNATDTATLESAARAGTETLGAGMVQLEVGTFKSSRITTTTAAVTRNADVLTYAKAGNFSDASGTVYSEYEHSSWANAGGEPVVGDSGAASTTCLRSTPNVSGVSAYDGTNNINGAAGTPSGVVAGAVVWGGVTGRAYANGTAGAVASYDGTWGFTDLAVCHQGSGVLAHFYGTIKNLRIYSRALSDAQLQAMTS